LKSKLDFYLLIYTRFQEIAGGLDSTLTNTFSPTGLNEAQGKPLLLKQSIKLLESLDSCWSDEVLVFSHCDKFLRLSLQLISRYNYCKRYIFSFCFHDLVNNYILLCMFLCDKVYNMAFIWFNGT
jgi:hypothetical protein